MGNDIRYALRSFRRSPVFTAVALLSLALGIGANTAIFTLLDQALLQSLPVRDPERLVVLSAGDLHLRGTSSSDNHETVYSLQMYREVRNRSDIFEGVVARGGLPPVVLRQGSGNDYADVELVSGNYFEVLGVQALLGRTITPADDVTPGGHPVVVLPHATWMKRFGGDPGIIGRTISLNKQSYTVLGVLPPRFYTVVRGQTPNVIVPLSMQKQIFADMEGDKPDTRWVNLVARLKPGVSREQAEAGIQSTWRGILEELLKASNTVDKQRVLQTKLQLIPGVRGIDTLRRNLETPLTVLMATVGFVLLIACVNIAALLLARAAAKQRDTAIRLSFGASRGRIMRQVLTESLILAIAGGALGILVASWLTPALLKLVGDSTEVMDWYLDSRVLLFAGVVSVMTALFFGGVPALQTVSADISTTLRKQAGNIAGSHARIRKVLVAAQISLATLLLFGAGLFARSLGNLMQVDPGFRTEKVMTFVLSPRQAGYDKQRGTQLYTELVARLKQLPGVTAVAGAAPGPMTGSNRGSNLTVESYTPPPQEEAGSSVHSVTPGWFSTLGIRFVTGRDFTEADRDGSPKVVIVNAAFARKYCGGDAVGKRMKWGTGKGDLDTEIIGQFADIHTGNLREAATPAVYMPYTQEQQLQRMTFYVRSANDPLALAGALRDSVRALDADLPVYRLKPLTDEITEAVSADRTLAILCTAFGVLAILLTAIGIYGVIAWTVARRTNEIAVRVALGALPDRVLRLVMREVVVLAGVGIAVGVVLALASARLVEAKLFGVTGRDPLMLGVAIGCTAVMAGLASFVPAWRATRIDPARALRFD